MTLIILLLGVVLFLSFILLFMLAMPRTSHAVALLEEVTRTRPAGGTDPVLAGPSRSAVMVDLLARPFALFRNFFRGEPDALLARRLALAGYRNPAHSDIFLGARLALPAVLGFSVALMVSENAIFFFLMTVVAAFFFPDIWLVDAIKRRRQRVTLSLPDGLDLLSICMEAGLGLDQAIVRVGQELRVSHPDLCEELLQINFEQRAGIPRMDSWKSFAERIDTENLRSFVAMLIQTERFGTPISSALNAFSEGLRTQRRQYAEEQAAKSSVKLVLPLAFFIFPETFIVTVGPAIINMIHNVGTLLS